LGGVKIKTKYFIITGSSRGIGLELSRKLLSEYHYVICLSRTENIKTKVYALKNNYRYAFYSIDLSSLTQTVNIMRDLIADIIMKDSESICLINNAAVVEPIKSIENCTTEEIITGINTNLISPIILTSSFINLTNNSIVNRIVINISSGSGVYPAAAMSVYCSTKAGNNMFTQCVGLEQQSSNNPVRIYSVDPGMVNTELQETARNTNNEDFILRKYFQEAKLNGTLRSPDQVAMKIIEIIKSEYKTGELIDI
jgi:benzil reductase ((S)-benzoin forming)